MIYLDVTSSCKSPLQTGVQRMARGLWRCLDKKYAVTPLIWSPKLQSYCRLSFQEETFLCNPFRGTHHLAVHPERAGLQVPGLKAWRHFVHWKNRLGLERMLKKDDALLVPEIFQDNRTQWFSANMKDFRAKKVKCVAIFHDAITWTHPELTPSNRQKGFQDYLRSLASFETVPCVSEQSRADLARFWSQNDIKKTRTEVFSWPVDFLERPQARPLDAKNFKNPEHSKSGLPMVLAVGTLEPRKNHLRLLEACEKLWSDGMNFQLALVGRALGGFQEVPLRIRKIQKMGRPLDWLFHVDDQTLRRTYQTARFTVYPSLVEGFGLPILESLWFGRPCVCSGMGAIGEAAQGGGCLTINPAKTEDLAQAIRRLLLDDRLYDGLCNEIPQRTFRSWEDYLTDLEKILQPSAS